MEHYSEGSADSELWQVEMAPGDVRTLTLEQLDQALELGMISTETRVWQEGMDAAVALHELLGEDSEDAPPVEPTPYDQALGRDVTLAGMSPPSLPELVPSFARLQESAPPLSAPPPAYVAPAYAAPPAYVAPAYAAPPAYVAPAYAAPPSYRAQPPAYASPPAYRPSVAPPAEVSAWPPVVSAPPPSSSAYHSSVVPSVAPMAFDLGDDDVPFAKPKRRGMPLVASLVVLLAAGGGFAAYKNGALDSTTPAVAAQAAAPIVQAAPVPEKSHAYDPGDAPIHWRDPTPPSLSSAVSDALAAKPKDAHAAKPVHATAARKAVSRKSGKSSGFGTKGNKYDPLNGSL